MLLRHVDLFKPISILFHLINTEVHLDVFVRKEDKERKKEKKETYIHTQQHPSTPSLTKKIPQTTPPPHPTHI